MSILNWDSFADFLSTTPIYKQNVLGVRLSDTKMITLDTDILAIVSFKIFCFLGELANSNDISGMKFRYHRFDLDRWVGKSWPKVFVAVSTAIAWNNNHAGYGGWPLEQMSSRITQHAKLALLWKWGKRISLANFILAACAFPYDNVYKKYDEISYIQNYQLYIM